MSRYGGRLRQRAGSLRAGGVTIADLNSNNPLPLTSARVTLQNNTTSPDEEAVINSYFAEDFTPKMRTLTFEATYKWRDAELYRYAFNGGSLTSAVINPCLSYRNTVLTVQSPCDIDPGEDYFQFILDNEQTGYVIPVI